MEKLFLLDAYAFIYRAYYAFIRSPRINSKGKNTSAVLGFVNTLEEVLSKENPDYLAVAFDPAGPTFRHEAYPEYKAQREATPEDILYSVPVIKDIVRAYRIPIVEVPGYEADDVIGTLSVQAEKAGVRTFMMTPDKDYGQLVTENINMYCPRHGGGFDVMGPREVCEKYGVSRTEQIVDLLALMGDASDNVPGCPGVGQKTAVKLVDQFGSVADLLESTGDLKGALRRKVEEGADKIRFSKFLVTIKTDVPIELDLEAFRRVEPDLEALSRIFDELEFRNLAERVKKRHGVGNDAAASQPSLFPEIEDEARDEQKQTTLATISDIQHEYHLVDTEDGIADLIKILLTKEILSIDTETTSVAAMTANLVGMSFSAEEGEAWYVPVPQNTEAARAVVEQFRPVFENVHSLKVGQNLKYDIMVLAHYGIEVRGPIYDTMLAHYVLQPEQQRHNMDYMAEVYLGYRTIHIDELIGPKGKGQKSMADLSPADVYEYACEDADVTLRLYHRLSGLLSPEADRLLRDVELPLVRVLAGMERNGVRLDTGALAATGELFDARIRKIEEEIFAYAGHEFNIDSPRQVGVVLFEELKVSEKARRTKGGQYATSVEVLEALRDAHPIVGKILDYRALRKLVNTYVKALPGLVNPATGHIHTSYNQAVTVTGRLSSSDPNLQNIPVRGEDGREIRKSFVPDDGCLFFSADYSQIELRIMAHLSGDEHLVKAFVEGADVHAATAARIFHKKLEEVTRDERRKAKTANFGIIYGISAFGLAERMGVSRTEARTLIENYFSMYPGVKRYMDESVEKARARGYAETAFGRRRYLPDIASRNATLRGEAERNAINSPIQGTAADIIKVAMIRIHERMKREGMRSKMILQVHDELNFSVVPEEKEAMEALVVEEMEGAFAMAVPLKVDCGWGNNWLEAH